MPASGTMRSRRLSTSEGVPSGRGVGLSAACRSCGGLSRIVSWARLVWQDFTCWSATPVSLCCMRRPQRNPLHEAVAPCLHYSMVSSNLTPAHIARGTQSNLLHGTLRPPTQSLYNVKHLQRSPSTAASLSSVAFAPKTLRDLLAHIRVSRARILLGGVDVVDACLCICQLHALRAASKQALRKHPTRVR